ncbi:MAG: hypothetical protein ACR2PZ_16295 [Pseudomonadales bacterium]
MSMATAIRRETVAKAAAPAIVVRERKVDFPLRRPRPTSRPQPAPKSRAKPNPRPPARAKPAKTLPVRKPPARRRQPRIEPAVAEPSLATRLAAPFGFGLAAAALTYGWLYRDERALRADMGLGYVLGIVAVGCMLTLLVYPLRKRLHFLRFLGSVKNWFRTHMQLGVLGPLAALYHCNFQVGSLNSQIALYCALLVAGSGLVGRFLYRKIHRSLYGRKTDMKQVRAELLADRFPRNQALPFLPLLKQRVHRFDHSVLLAGEGLWSSIGTTVVLGRRARRERRILSHFCKQQIGREAERNKLIAAHGKRLHWAVDRYLFAHMARLRLLAKMQAYERLFSLWHVVHLPFFVLLVISVVIHVLAVHLY